MACRGKWAAVVVTLSHSFWRNVFEDVSNHAHAWVASFRDSILIMFTIGPSSTTTTIAFHPLYRWCTPPPSPSHVPLKHTSPDDAWQECDCLRIEQSFCGCSCQVHRALPRGSSFQMKFSYTIDVFLTRVMTSSSVSSSLSDLISFSRFDFFLFVVFSILSFWCFDGNNS